MAVDKLGNELREGDLVEFLIPAAMVVTCHVKKIDPGGTIIATKVDKRTGKPLEAGMMAGVLHLELDWEHAFNPENPVVKDVVKLHVDPNNARLIEQENQRKNPGAKLKLN